MKMIIAMFTAFAAMILPATAHAQFAQPGTFAQPGGSSTVQTNAAGTITGGTATAFIPDGNDVYNNGQVQVRNGTLHSPVQTVNINNSGCSRNLLNAIACIGAQTVGQVFVNRSAVREQRDATIVVERARFTLGQGGGEAYGSPAPAGPAMVQCTLNVGGQTQTIRVTEADCQRAAADYGTTAQRR